MGITLNLLCLRLTLSPLACRFPTNLPTSTCECGHRWVFEQLPHRLTNTGLNLKTSNNVIDQRSLTNQENFQRLFSKKEIYLVKHSTFWFRSEPWEVLVRNRSNDLCLTCRQSITTLNCSRYSESQHNQQVHPFLTFHLLQNQFADTHMGVQIELRMSHTLCLNRGHVYMEIVVKQGSNYLAS